ncbi:MAG: sigma-54 dependent transcriptional regulator [Ignavibacteriales bacterium]|nr:sigma-54 dependent transcriptional regulator [Ignavibacteriales bacterium]
MTAVISLLLIEDEEFDVRRVRNTLAPLGDRIRIRDVVSNGRLAVDLLAKNPDAYDVVIMDFQIAGGLMGERLIHELKKIDPSLQIMVITKMTVNISDYQFATTLLQAGAFWYCTKYPGDIEDYIYQPTDFLLGIMNGYQRRVMEKERQTSRRKLLRNIEEVLAQKTLIGVSASIKELRQQIELCAANDAPVLISGFSGTGKEIVAYNIHYRSNRKFDNFVPVNCGSLPSELIESELFGYEKGAFTGANARKQGLFEIADNGTLFLDEISELPFPAQVKLLRVIQDGEIEKIGRTSKVRVNVRIIAATNKDLEEEMKQKRFREDLYYRLNVVPLHAAPLSERRDDIPILMEHFLKIFSLEMSRPVPDVTSEAGTAFAAHPWPGNVRELKNVAYRLLYAGDQLITPVEARKALGTSESLSASSGTDMINFGMPGEIIPWRQMEKKMREKYFIYVRKHSASDAEAAKRLGLAPSNYHRMCKELGLKG